MPDWEGLVQQRLGRLHLAPAAENEIIRELAGHLEDRYLAARAAGASEQQARDAALRELGNPQGLARRLRGQKETLMNMTPLKKRVLLPAGVALVLSGFSIWIAYIYGPKHIAYFWESKSNGILYAYSYSGVGFYKALLIAMLLIGGVAAWLARRRGATVAQRLLVAALPALLNVLIFAAGTVLSATLGHSWQPLSGRAPVLMAPHVGTVPWLITPVAYALLGAAPFLFSKGRDQQPVSHSAAPA